jgi:glycosyltransferase involved in cell wall biosynthesis
MSCGIPCVVTDVGDSGLIVDEIGTVVPPRNPEALAAGWGAMAERIRQNPELRFAVRERIISQFSLSALIGNTSEALLGAL